MNFSGNKAVRFLDFLLRDSYSRQIVFKSTTVNWVWPDVPSHAQTCLNVSGGDFQQTGYCHIKK